MLLNIKQLEDIQLKNGEKVNKTLNMLMRLIIFRTQNNSLLHSACPPPRREGFFFVFPFILIVYPLFPITSPYIRFLLNSPLQDVVLLNSHACLLFTVCLGGVLRPIFLPITIPQHLPIPIPSLLSLSLPSHPYPSPHLTVFS